MWSQKMWSEGKWRKGMCVCVWREGWMRDVESVRLLSFSARREESCCRGEGKVLIYNYTFVVSYLSFFFSLPFSLSLFRTNVWVDKFVLLSFLFSLSLFFSLLVGLESLLFCLLLFCVIYFSMFLIYRYVVC